MESTRGGIGEGGNTAVVPDAARKQLGQPV